MRISKLTLHDFLNHAHSELELGGLTVVAGPNNAGKSAIKDAIQMLLTGTARTTDKRGAGAEELTRVGSNGFELTALLEVTRGGTITAAEVRRAKGELDVRTDVTWGGSIGLRQEELHKLLGADGRVITACLHAGSLPELPPKEQEALLFDLMALEFDAAAVMELIKGHGCTAEDMRLLWHPDLEEFRGLNDAKLPSGTYSHEVFELLYHEAYSARTAVRKRAKELEAIATREREAENQAGLDTPALLAIKEDVPGKLIQLEAQLATLRAQRDEILTRLTRAQEHQGGLSVTTLKAAVREEQKELKAAVAWEAKWRELLGTEGKLETFLPGLREGVREWEAKLSLTTARVRALTDTAAKFGGRPICPLTKEQCPLDGVRRKNVVKVLTERAEVEEQARGHQAVELEGLKAKLARVEELQAAKGRKAARIRAELEQSKKLLADRETMEAVDLTALEEELTELTRRVEAGPGRIKMVEEWGAQLERTKESGHKAAVAEQELSAWERLCKALGPKGGVRARAIAGPLKELEARINARLHEYSPSHRVELTSGEGFELRVYGPGSADYPLPIKGLSTSERLRVGIALQDALCHLTGLRFLLIDNVDMLDARNRNKLMETLDTMRPDYDTIVVLATMDSQEEALGAPPTRTYWVERGTVSLLEEEVAL